MEALWAAVAVVAPTATVLFLVGVLPNMLDNHHALKQRELDIREKEADARIAEAKRPR